MKGEKVSKKVQKLVKELNSSPAKTPKKAPLKPAVLTPAQEKKIADIATRVGAKLKKLQPNQGPVFNDTPPQRQQRTRFLNDPKARANFEKGLSASLKKHGILLRPVR